MIVYADILVTVNFITDYFLLRAAAFFVHKAPSVPRLLLGAATGGVASLYIFLPSYGIAADFFFKLLLSLAMSLAAFGFCDFKSFLRASAALLLTACAYGGIMTALWYTLRPQGMAVVNSVVYFDISPTVLICTTVIAYFLLRVVAFFLKRSSKTAKECKITLYAENKSVTVRAIVDTGNSVDDILGGGAVIIADRACAVSIFGECDPKLNSAVKSRYRALPCGTVTGGGMLEGYRCDSALVESEKRSIRLKNPVLAISAVPIRDGYSAIVNPEIFL